MEVLKPKLSVRNLCKSYDNRTVLNNLSFDLMEGEFLSILGPSGCGKTTLLRILIGLEKADGGEILKSGRDISKLPSFEPVSYTHLDVYKRQPKTFVVSNINARSNKKP